MPAKAGIHVFEPAISALMKSGWVYIMTNKPFGTLYIGVTSDIAAREDPPLTSCQRRLASMPCHIAAACEVHLGMDPSLRWGDTRVEIPRTFA